MVAPIVRDVNVIPPRSGAAGSQGLVQEAIVRCWTGRNATTCTVVADYGPTTSYGTTTPPTLAGGFHELSLGDLTPGTYYHVRLTATDPTDAANPTQTQDYGFTQTPNVVPPGPTVIWQPLTGLTATGATVNWTSSPACPNGEVRYATTLAALQSAPTVKPEVGTGTRTAHTVPLTGLTTATRYYYRVYQPAPDGSATLTSVQSFLTP